VQCCHCLEYGGQSVKHSLNHCKDADCLA
jgi:hypothetical protein